MAQTAVDIVVKTIGGGSLDRLNASLSRTEQKIVKVQSAFTKQQQVTKKVGSSLLAAKREYERLTNAIKAAARAGENTEKLVVAARKAKGEVSRLREEFERSKRAASGYRKELDGLADKQKRVGATANGAANALGGLTKRLAIAAAGYVTVRGAAELAGNAIRESVARESAERRLAILAKQFGEVDEAVALATRSASKFGLGLTETTGQITQVYARLRPLGATVEEIETVFNGFNTAARLGGSTAAEASGAFLQLSQALGSGYLRGQEFNSVAEQAPMVLQAIAKETGLAVGQLKEFAAEGGITSDIVLRALKRIETEGAGQLAEALETPQQAFKDLQNAVEDFNVALGDLLQPAVLEFVRGLTGLLKDLTGEIDKTKKAAEFLAEQLKVLAPLGDAVKAGFDQMGIGFVDFVNTIAANLPVIGGAIQMLQKLAQLRDFLAQQQDNSKGGRNFGDNYKSQEKALFAAAGGYTPYSSGGGLSAASPSPVGGGGSGGGGKSSADAAARAAEQEERRLKAARELLAAAQAEIGIKQALTPVIEAQLKSQEQIRQINAEYADKIAEATSEETRKVLEQAKGVEIQLEGVKLEKELADLRESAVGSIQDEIEMLRARLNGTEEVLEAEREIAKLKAKGVSGAEAQGLVETRNQLKQQVEAQDQARESAEQLAGSIASGLTNSLKGLITGSMSAEEALSNAFQSIANAFIDMAMQMIQEWIKMQIMGLVGAFFGGAAGGGGGFGVTPLTSGMNFFAEGGFVSSPTKAMIGEGSSDEYVIPSDKMGSAMQRYNAGARGDAVVDGASRNQRGTTQDGVTEYMKDNLPINITTGPVMAFEGQNYVSQEQFAAGVKAAAKEGEARAIRRLQMSPSTRRRVGV